VPIEGQPQEREAEAVAIGRVEIEVLLPDGGRARYVEDGPGQDNAVAGLPGPAITRSMAVSGEVVGELTVWLSEPHLPVPRDESAISAYGDALAGALHDAAARVRLAALDARDIKERKIIGQKKKGRKGKRT